MIRAKRTWREKTGMETEKTGKEVEETGMACHAPTGGAWKPRLLGVGWCGYQNNGQTRTSAAQECRQERPFGSNEVPDGANFS
jgi:hypothetical protein